MTDESRFDRAVKPKTRQQQTHGGSGGGGGKSGHVMRKMVRNMVTHMEYVLKDIQGIMGDIKTLVVQIDSVTNKIDDQCSTKTTGIDQRRQQHQQQDKDEENHVVRKPETIDCQTYWSKSLSRQSLKETKKKKMKNEASSGSRQGNDIKGNDDDPFQGYEIPVLPTSLCPSGNPIHQILDSPSKLSNVERWLVQDNARCYERITQASNNSKKAASKKTLNNKCVQFRDNQKGPKRKSLGCKELGDSHSVYVPHMVKQPCAQHHQKGGCANEHETTSGFCTGAARIPRKHSYTNVATYDEVPLDETTTKPLKSSTEPSFFFMPQRATPHPPHPHHTSSNDPHKRIRVYNYHYEENTSNTDDSPMETNPSHLSQSKMNEFNVILPQCSLSKPHSANTGNVIDNTKKKCWPNSTTESSSLIIKHSSVKHHHSPLPSIKFSQFSRPLSRNNQSLDSGSHKYQSLESDLDSINDCNDPRCNTPDMDWSYLGLMGGGSSKRVLDKSSKHVYETIASPKFQRRKTKYTCNVAKSVSFHSSSEVVSKLICVENLNFVSGTPESDSSGKGNSFVSREPSIVNGLEELDGSVILDHVFCEEVTDPECEEYCGYYEAIVDAVLENLSGYSSLEEACASLESRSEILEETYIGFDDDFFDDEWDIGIKSSSEYYYEDDIDFSLSIIPQRKINIHSKYFENSPFATNLSFMAASAMGGSVTFLENHLLLSAETQHHHQQQQIMMSLTDERTPSSSEAEKILYDDVDIFEPSSQFENDDHSLPQQNSSHSDEKEQLSIVSLLHPIRRLLAHTSDNSSTSSDEVSDEAMASGSSNMSFGSIDLSSTPLMDSDRGSSLTYATDPTNTVTAIVSPRKGYEEEHSDIIIDEEVHPPPESNNCSNKRTDTNDAIVSRTCALEERLGSAIQELGGGCLNESASVTTTRRESLTHLRKNSIPTDNECEPIYGASVDDTIAYNRNVNTWTAYAMVHVPGDDISDTASDIINDNNSVNDNNSINSINNSMTSSYLDADNSAVAQLNQGFVDT